MKLMLTCKQTSQIISQSLDKPLSGSDRLRLKFHLVICAACSRFNQQLHLLNTAVKRLIQATENDDTIQLGLEAKARMTKVISAKKH